mgnify:CR=1 FL=1
MSRDLARIRLDAPVPTKMDAYLMRQPDEEKAVKTLNQLEMFSMITRLGLHPDEKKILSGRGEDCLAVASAPQASRCFCAGMTNGLILPCLMEKRPPVFLQKSRRCWSGF